MAKRRKGRPGMAKNKVRPNVLKQNLQTNSKLDIIQQNTYPNQTSIPKSTGCYPVYASQSLSSFPPLYQSIKGVDLQSMLSLQWDAALEQWASRVSPKLASPHLPMAFFLFQDAAFVGALAWSVFIIRLFLHSMGEMLILL